MRLRNTLWIVMALVVSGNVGDVWADDATRPAPFQRSQLQELALRLKPSETSTRDRDLPPVIRPPVLLVRMLQEPVADSPRRCGAGRDYRFAASVQ